MGCYFRVAFYGDKFNELNGVTLIYKEKPFTKLPEIAHRLQSMYYEQVRVVVCLYSYSYIPGNMLKLLPSHFSQ